MNNKSLLILLMCFSLVQCKTQTNPEYFEGIITYKVDYKSKNNPNDKPYGDTLTVYVKDGHTKHSYNTTQIGGIKEETYNPDKGVIIMRLVGIDTLYWYDVSENQNLKLTKSVINNSSKSILDRKCKVLSAQTLYEDGDFRFITDYTYYFSDVLRIDPKWFENFKFGFSKHFYTEMKAFCLRQEMSTIATSFNIEVIRFEKKNLSQDNFIIQENLPIKEFMMN